MNIHYVEGLNQVFKYTYSPAKEPTISDIRKLSLREASTCSRSHNSFSERPGLNSVSFYTHSNSFHYPQPSIMKF